MDARGTSAAPPRKRGAIRFFSPALSARYSVDSVLGASATSVVYRALDKEAQRTVALKLVRTRALETSDLVRYRHGLAAARLAQSPGLVRILETGEVRDTLTITLEDVGGESLAQRLARGRLEREAALRIAGDVLNALTALHGLGIVHRNLKPSNVLLPAAGGAVLTDWGLARRWEAVVEGDARDGALDYVSPEQALGKEMDERSDLYSFGALLFEMLTGRPPFEASRPIGLLRAHLRERPPDVRLLDARLPPWLAVVTDRLLEKDPEARYASAADALADLGAHHARRAMRRRRRRALLVAAEALLAVGLTSAWFGYQERTLDSVHLLVDAGKHRLEVLDGRGRELWTAAGVANATDVALLRRAGADWAVVTPGEHDGTLTLSEPRTGALVGRVALPGATAGIAEVRAVDLDGRGSDVLLGAYRDREGTWSVAVHDPVSRVARRVLVSTSPHAFAGAADLDGDGRRELLLAGTADAFGRALGVAACRVPASGAEEPAITPELGDAGPVLVWYALAPQPSPSHPNLQVDAGAPAVTIDLGGGLRRSLQSDGFLREDRSAAGGRERALHRAAAYALLRDAAGARADVIAPARSAADEARRAGDSTLAEWAERAHAVALVRAGRAREGGRLLSELASHARVPSEVALDAARALHATGERAAAIAWYREGLAQASGPGARAAAELARGMVAAYGELGRWNDAVLELDRAEALNPALSLETFSLRAEIAAKLGRVK